MSDKIFVADKATLDNVDKNVQRLADELIGGTAAVYGMIIHENNLDPATRVEYIGANKDYAPMSMDFATHEMNYGGWANWDWLKANVPVMANFDGGINYYLDPNDYTKKTDGTASDVRARRSQGRSIVCFSARSSWIPTSCRWASTSAAR